ncbi:hypothetical protein SAMN05216275_102310 [Streptosporangium canum]|uniref:Uncharacterized protein n=1 Tax=Streptosporangium canum TaxID=324952 RepID=A0A1I3H187_9ACTN|nr:hypothetical protein SAMN05216275_102310 [Streptosporangium canum]
MRHATPAKTHHRAARRAGGAAHRESGPPYHHRPQKVSGPSPEPNVDNRPRAAGTPPPPPHHTATAPPPARAHHETPRDGAVRRDGDHTGIPGAKREDHKRCISKIMHQKDRGAGARRASRHRAPSGAIDPATRTPASTARARRRRRETHGHPGPPDNSSSPKTPKSPQIKIAGRRAALSRRIHRQIRRCPRHPAARDRTGSAGSGSSRAPSVRRRLRSPRAERAEPEDPATDPAPTTPIGTMKSLTRQKVNSVWYKNYHRDASDPIA